MRTRGGARPSNAPYRLLSALNGPPVTDEHAQLISSRNHHASLTTQGTRTTVRVCDVHTRCVTRNDARYTTESRVFEAVGGGPFDVTSGFA